MTVLSFNGPDEHPRFSEEACAKAGREFAQSYQTASPFPHIVIDDFLPTDFLRQVAAHYPDKERAVSFKRNQENLKFQFHPETIDFGPSRALLAALNSQPFLTFLSEMTGIPGLISDPYFAGGGLHQTLRGGHLGVHADFNRHKVMNVRRRLNVLIYLNEDWQDEWGGHLELWSKDMRACEHSVAPVIGRCVVFSTDLDSYHGHPDPLATPEGVSRKSIATYYYTAVGELNDQPDRTTNFQRRPGSADQSDMKTQLRHFAKEWVPPAIRRMASKAKS